MLPGQEHFEKIYVKTYLETSQNNFSKAIATADSLYIHSSDPLLKTRSLMLSASLYQQKGDYKKAVKYALAAEKEVNSVDNYSWKARIFGFLASQYRILELYDLSAKYTEDCIEAAKKIKDSMGAKQMTGLMMQEKAYFLLDRKDYRKSILSVKESQKLLSNVKNNQDFYSANNEQLLGLNYFHLGEYETSLKHYSAALDQTKLMPETFLNGLIFDGIANVYLSLGNIKESESNLKKAQEIADRTEFLQLKKKIYETAQRLYTAKQEISSLKEVSDKKDSIQNQLEKSKNSLVNSLIAESEQKRHDAEMYGIHKNIMLTLFLLCLAFCVIYFIYYKKAQRKTYTRFKAIISELKRRSAEKNKSSLEVITKEENKTNSSNAEINLLMTSETEEKLLLSLQQFENSDLYLRNDISLPTLASYCKTNTKYLSRIINKYKGMDFNNYINSLRINYIIEKLNNHPEYRKYKIASLAEESGFSSQNKFATIFKKVTDISPSLFIKCLQDQDNNNQSNNFSK